MGKRKSNSKAGASTKGRKIRRKDKTAPQRKTTYQSKDCDFCATLNPELGEHVLQNHSNASVTKDDNSMEVTDLPSDTVDNNEIVEASIGGGGGRVSTGAYAMIEDGATSIREPLCVWCRRICKGGVEAHYEASEGCAKMAEDMRQWMESTPQCVTCQVPLAGVTAHGQHYESPGPCRIYWLGLIRAAIKKQTEAERRDSVPNESGKSSRTGISPAGMTAVAGASETNKIFVTASPLTATIRVSPPDMSAFPAGLTSLTCVYAMVQWMDETPECLCCGKELKGRNAHIDHYLRAKACQNRWVKMMGTIQCKGDCRQCQTVAGQRDSIPNEVVESAGSQTSRAGASFSIPSAANVITANYGNDGGLKLLETKVSGRRSSTEEGGVRKAYAMVEDGAAAQTGCVVNSGAPGNTTDVPNVVSPTVNESGSRSASEPLCLWCRCICKGGIKAHYKVSEGCAKIAGDVTHWMEKTPQCVTCGMSLPGVAAHRQHYMTPGPCRIYWLGLIRAAIRKQTEAERRGSVFNKSGGPSGTVIAGAVPAGMTAVAGASETNKIVVTASPSTAADVTATVGVSLPDMSAFPAGLTSLICLSAMVQWMDETPECLCCGKELKGRNAHFSHYSRAKACQNRWVKMMGTIKCKGECEQCHAINPTVVGQRNSVPTRFVESSGAGTPRTKASSSTPRAAIVITVDDDNDDDDGGLEILETRVAGSSASVRGSAYATVSTGAIGKAHAMIDDGTPVQTGTKVNCGTPRNTSAVTNVASPTVNDSGATPLRNPRASVVGAYAREG